MGTVLRAINLVNKIITILLGVLLGIMSIVIIFQISSRFLLGIPLPWSEELARYLMAYCVFIGAALALKNQQLIGVEFLSERLSVSNRTKLKIIVHIIAIGLFIILFLKGIEMMGRVSAQMSAALQIPMSVPYACIPIGAVLLILNAIAVMIELKIGKEVSH